MNGNGGKLITNNDGCRIEINETVESETNLIEEYDSN